MKNLADLVWATLGEGGLVLALAAIGWATNQPLIFASLGPTAYELVEQPQMPSARPYNIVVGHLIGLGAGFLAVYLLNAWAAPNVLATGVVSAQRMWAHDHIGCAHHLCNLGSKGGATCGPGDHLTRLTGSDAS